MNWSGRYTVLPDGRLFWVEGYSFPENGPLFEMFAASPWAQQVLANFGQHGVRIGEA